ASPVLGAAVPNGDRLELNARARGHASTLRSRAERINVTVCAHQKSKPAAIDNVRCAAAVSFASQLVVVELGMHASFVPVRSSIELPASANCASSVIWKT